MQSPSLTPYEYFPEIDYVLVIPEDFSEKFAAGDRERLLDGTAVPGSSSSYLAEYDMESFLKTADMYLSAGFEISALLFLPVSLLSYGFPPNILPGPLPAPPDPCFPGQSPKKFR